MRWEQGRGTVDGLIRDGRVERVAASRELADLMLTQAHTHLLTARTIAASDPAAAFQTAYDAARKALAAILANQGLRVKSGEGAHKTLLVVTMAQLNPPLGEQLQHFDWLRRTRNATEYPALDTPVVSHDDVGDALPLAEDIVDVAYGVIDAMPVY